MQPHSAAIPARFTDWSGLRSELFWIYRGPVHPLGRKWSAWDVRQIGWLVERGSVTLRMGRRRLVASEGQWLFLPPGHRSQDWSPRARILSIAFAFRWPDGSPLFDHDHPVGVAADAFPHLRARALSLQSLVDRHFPQASNRLFAMSGTLVHHLEVRWHFDAWLAEYARTLLASGLALQQKPSVDPRVEEALRFLQGHPLASSFREEMAANSVYLSVQHLNRLFVRDLAMTVMQCYQKRRMQAAAESLQTPGMPIKMIAYELGFQSLSHFSRWFSARQKMSPRAFRLRLRGVPE